MAQATLQQDGTILLTLSNVEQIAMVDPAVFNAFAEYCTLWIENRTHELFNERFKLLSPEDQQLVLSKFAGGSGGA
jgi:hypothetical protein